MKAKDQKATPSPRGTATTLRPTKVSSLSSLFGRGCEYESARLMLFFLSTAVGISAVTALFQL
ncbi:hypothetical protein BU26DRAFT_521765 [Trematosphaeria pertusa]|uniref:Uncharacterized protein n=1 Tax=Trematosphaeria pertusa TaxID=390896 RepID=A0A6A6I7T7_9PLEO|nr:uncharacterized protein BU26DRAFT_521765 [Trematosphaeria pertusa]KAF2246357.1 hypothetical protein BU26DRAFT_521765 [Trematosphaeria pertusa]